MVLRKYENLLDLKDAKGKFVILDEINVIRESGEGVVEDFWPKPDKNPETAYLKISLTAYLTGDGFSVPEVILTILKKQLHKILILMVINIS